MSTATLTKQTDSQLTPNELFNKYYFLVKNTTYKTLKNPISIAKINKIDVDDLYQYGSEGLWQACVTYNPSLSKFRSHAINHIRWALKDALNTDCQFIQYDKRKGFTNETKHRITSIDIKATKEQDLEMYEVIEDESTSNLHNEERLQYEHYLEGLNDRQKLITKLRVEGSAVTQISQKLKISRQAVYQELDNIKEKLKGVLFV